MKLKKKKTIKETPSKLFILLILVILLFIAPSILETSDWEAVSEKKMARLLKKWSGIKSWEASYNERYRSSKQWQISPGITISSEVIITGNGHYTLDVKEGGAGNITEWYGYGSGHYSSVNTVTLSAYVDGKSISVIETTKSVGSGFIGNREDEKYGASLDIDVLSGGYSAGFDLPYSSETTLTRKVTGLPTSLEKVSKLPPGLRAIFLPLAMKAEDWSTFNGDINDTSPMVGGMIGFQLFGDMDEPKEHQLPENGLALKGSYRGKYISNNWSLIPSGKGRELILEKCDRSWLPEDKNSIKIAVKGDGWYGEKVKIRFTLFKITSEAGTCLNSKDDNKDLDLDFYHPDNTETKFSTIERIKDDFIAETAKEVKNSTITVASRDFGSWGKLKAEAGLGGVWYPVLTEEGKSYITIPLDESGGKENHIGDKFEKEHSLDPGVDPLLDKEDPEKRGDGLSAYEEYRGFFIGKGNRHYRTDPNKPDLFLFPDTRRLGQYLREIRNNFPMGIKVHIIEEDQYKYHMAINPNNNLHNIVIQHGIWVVERNLDPGVLGRRFGSFGSPKDCFYAAIDFAEHKTLGYGNKKYIFNTIVHEIFHGLNVWHHGDPHKLVNFNGENYRQERDGGDKFKAAKYNGISSGDISCVMTYGTAFYYESSPGIIAKNEVGNPILFKYTIDNKVYSHLCVQQTGTGAGENLQLGPATVGECATFVQISDK